MSKESESQKRYKRISGTRGTKIQPGEFPLLETEYMWDKNEKSLFDYTKSNRFKAWWKCSECGHEWQTKIESRICSGSGCPICARKRRAQKRSENTPKIISGEFPLLETEFDSDKNEKSLFEYSKGCDTKVWWKCSKCGHEWQASVRSRVEGKGCRQCYIASMPERRRKYIQPGEFPILEQEYDNELNSKSIYEFYRTCDEIVWWKCAKCGATWEARISARLNGHHGCEECAKTTFSSCFDRFVYLCLSQCGYNVLHRDRYTIGKELDIYLPQEKIALEPGIWFYHKDKIYEDFQKQNDCLKKGIVLWTIYFNVSDDFEPLSDKYLLMQYPVSPSEYKACLTELEHSIFCSLPRYKTPNNWEELLKIAKQPEVWNEYKCSLSNE